MKPSAEVRKVEQRHGKLTFFKSVTYKGSLYLKAVRGQGLVEEVDKAFFLHTDPQFVKNYPLGETFYTHKDIEFNTAVLFTDLQVLERLSTCKDVVDAFDTLLRGGTLKEESTNEVKVTVLSKLKERYPVPDIKDGFSVNENNWYLLVRNIKNSINTLVTGGTGCGKTSVVMLSCEKLGVNCNVYDMGTMHDPVSGLLGVHRLGKGGESIFDYAKFTQDIQKEGVILLDELSRAPAMAANILFPCLDHRRNLQIDIAGSADTRHIKVHPKCCFMATANIGNEYTGTLSLDRALQDRFFPLEMTTINENEELTVLCVRTGITTGQARMIVVTAGNIRKLYDEQKISTTISTRETLMAAEMVADGWSIVEAMSMVFCPMFEGTKTDGERSQVYKLFMAL